MVSCRTAGPTLPAPEPHEAPTLHAFVVLNWTPGSGHQRAIRPLWAPVVKPRVSKASFRALPLNHQAIMLGAGDLPRVTWLVIAPGEQQPVACESPRALRL